MSYQVNLHVPPSAGDLSKLSPENFVSITKHEGTVTTTDVYYQPSFKKTEGKMEKFLNNTSKFLERLKGFKPAGSSGSLHIAFSNINRNAEKKNLDIGGSFSNLIPTMMHKLATTDGAEHWENGTTFSLVNWTKDDGDKYVSSFATEDEKNKYKQQKKTNAEIHQIQSDLDVIGDVLKTVKKS